MKGAYFALLGQIPEVAHNDRGDPEKVLRYQVLRSRIGFLERHAVPFGATVLPTGDQILCFVVALEEGDEHRAMPPHTKVEYLACKVGADGSRITFAYLWFPSLTEAREYALRKGVNVMKGFRGS